MSQRITCVSFLNSGKLGAWPSDAADSFIAAITSSFVMICSVKRPLLHKAFWPVGFLVTLTAWVEVPRLRVAQALLPVTDRGAQPPSAAYCGLCKSQFDFSTGESPFAFGYSHMYPGCSLLKCWVLLAIESRKGLQINIWHQGRFSEARHCHCDE